MAKKFNTNGCCRPSRHYMVNMDSRLNSIVQMIHEGDYFVINRARQYGKTTILGLLGEKLSSSCMVFSISFEGMADSAYQSESSFCRRIAGLLYDTMDYGEVTGIPDHLRNTCYKMSLPETGGTDLRTLSNFISALCGQSGRPVLLLIDEVDQASGQEIFLAFLGMLRDKYLNRDKRPTFQSVILAGVYDIKNLKLKLQTERERLYNSPWNIAADFKIDISFSAPDIETMLQEYASDHAPGTDCGKLSRAIYEYTSGYPYLVSAICKIMDEQLPHSSTLPQDQIWSKQGITEAVKIILKEPNSLFDDIRKKIDDYPGLRDMLYAILFQGKSVLYNPDHSIIDIAEMLGLIREQNGIAVITNRIFETRLYNLFLSEDVIDSEISNAALLEKNQFIRNGRLDMDFVMEKFAEHFSQIYSEKDSRFIEEYGRKIFLLYLRPIINDVGNYYIEARTRERTDVIVDYQGEQYVIEMKIWHGTEYNRRGEQQLTEYLEEYHLQKGYLLSFNFNKNKATGLQKITLNGKTIIETVV